ncbi:MAG: glutaminyl-peptide cyclotransferase, partial [Bacteroidia bacterium]|nr:glutaminyl-peptide cyclotransferase [Bacteroidia bacterium]
HDTSSYTEGLLIYKGDLYESVGQHGQSKLIKTDLKTGKPLKSIDLDKKYFGEGIVIMNDTVYQWTYQEKIGFMYSLKEFKKIGEFKFASKEGWGMTTDGKQIIASDGTSRLYFYEPGSFRLIKTQDVTEAGNLAFNLNELEYIDGYIYANQWQSPYILKIDPTTGEVVGKIDFSKLCDSIKARYPYAEVFNGIAYDSTSKKIYITGKYWPELYEVQLGQ